MSLTLGAIAGSIGEAISGITQGAITIARIIAVIGFGTIFAGAILSLLGFIQQIVVTSVVGEFFAIISACLPFNASVVFGSCWIICEAVLAFLIARKIYELTVNMIGSTS